MKKIGLLIMILAGCREAYNPPVEKTGNSYLVVEGNIIAENDTTFIQLSRTSQIDTQNVLVAENNASVSVQDSSGNEYELLAKGNGLFAAQLNLDNNKQYRLDIKTSNGEEYISDYTPVLITPPIDSVFYSIDNVKGMNIYVTAHDDANKTKYYRFTSTETWQHNSKLYSSLIYDNGLRYRNPGEQIDHCWTTVFSSNINIVSLEGLSVSTVNKNPLVFIPHFSEKLSIVYSINVMQHALTKDAYNFWHNLKQNTEQLGSLFDPQPFANIGNIHCVNNPSEPVIGYISASTVSEKRIYIKNSEINWPLQVLPCIDTVADPAHTDFKDFFGGGFFVPLDYSNGSTSLIDATTPECGDCRVHGGTTIKPPYMP